MGTSHPTGGAGPRPEADLPGSWACVRRAPASCQSQGLRIHPDPAERPKRCPTGPARSAPDARRSASWAQAPISSGLTVLPQTHGTRPEVPAGRSALADTRPRRPGAAASQIGRGHAGDAQASEARALGAGLRCSRGSAKPHCF